jgi:uncharacterized protein
MPQLDRGFTLFMSLIVEALPFLLLGVFLSSFLMLLIDEQKLLKFVPKNPILAALIGSSIGFLLPVCECGNVPVARRLISQRLPISMAVGFLLAAPTINPIVIWATWTAFRDRPEIVILRVVFTLIIATIVGCIFSTQTDVKQLLQPAVALSMARKRPDLQAGSLESMLLQGGTFILGGDGGAALPMGEELLQNRSQPKLSWRSKLDTILDNVMQELRELGGILILGSALAAAIQTLTPRELIMGLGQGPILSIVVMMILAGTISICSTVDAFFALSFASTFTSGSLLAFLVFGPMFDLKSIGLLLSVFKPKPVLYLLLLSTQLTFFLTLFVNFNLS